MLFRSRSRTFTPNHSKSGLDSVIYPPGHRPANIALAYCTLPYYNQSQPAVNHLKRGKPSLQLLLFTNKERVGRREGEGEEEKIMGKDNHGLKMRYNEKNKHQTQRREDQQRAQIERGKEEKKTEKRTPFSDSHPTRLRRGYRERDIKSSSRKATTPPLLSHLCLASPLTYQAYPPNNSLIAPWTLPPLLRSAATFLSKS